ncbi:MAG: DUF11 domain-containing protein [Bacteroidales bacterium]|nr:DUF11 domain-containing protein [Bacteroidales bacterium]MCF8327599.1 DUF11 domain-containing protein [Bacteroidales bacterium]
MIRKLFTLTLVILLTVTTQAQITPGNFSFIQRQAKDTTYSTTGWGQDYNTGTTYTLYFGAESGSQDGFDEIMTDFEIGGKTYSPITLPNGECYSNVIVNRKTTNNSQVQDTAKQTIFFQRGTSSNNTLYFPPSYTNIQEAVNRRILNRGSDNVFANAGSETINNVERIDLIIEGGAFTPDSSKAGFLINERGGNDEFKVAAITSLDANGKVSAVGSLVSIGTGDWGSTGKSFQTTVFQRNSDDPVMKPDQNLSGQTIHGVFVTYEQLGINSNETMYGVSIFPGDVDNTMDLIGLSDVPDDTPTGSGGPGGLDMMGGGGYFGSEDVKVTDLQVDLTSNNMAPAEGDPIEITISLNNNGPTRDSNIVSTTTIPDGYTFDSFISGYNGSASQSSGTITWSFNPLAKDSSQNLTFKAIAEPSGDRTFTSNVNGDRTDVSPGNNSDDLTILLASDQDPLPVSLIFFNAESHKNKNIISWSTASEINNDYFAIERSTNGEDYKSIGVVNGYGNSNSVREYEFRDHYPTREVVYYKLKQVDYDGAYEYFGPIAVNPKAFEEKITVYPNPASEKLFVSGLNQDVKLNIYNPNGQIVYQKLNNQQTTQIDLSHLSNGLYYLHVVYSDGETKSKKISIE